MTTQITLPELATGQYNAGLILKEDGTPDYWLIGLPGELEAATWQQGMDWAKEQGGDLPNRRELNLLRANARKEFKNDMYWSNETTDYRTAFFQGFFSGDQLSIILSAECRVRAVSRFPA
jgi:hypothetical protein